jgi:hypothetical protein
MSDDDKEHDVAPAQPQSVITDESGFVPQYISAIKDVLVSPRHFFATLPDTGELLQPALFLAVTCLFSALGLGLFGRGLASVPHIMLFAMLGNYVFALFAFGVSRLVGGKGSLKNTVRVANYSIAPAIVSWIPMVGFAAGLYSCFLLSLGLQKVHGISTTKSLVITYTPFILFTVVMALISRMFHLGH